MRSNKDSRKPRGGDGGPLRWTEGRDEAGESERASRSKSPSNPRTGVSLRGSREAGVEIVTVGETCFSW